MREGAGPILQSNHPKMSFPSRTSCRQAARVASMARDVGGRGRIRTSVARKERQIYSLLVLATHPPVPRNYPGHTSVPHAPPGNRFTSATGSCANAERARVRRHQPLIFTARNPPASLPENSRPLKLSWRRDLNPRPSDYKSDALPTELRQPSLNQEKLSHRQSNCKGENGSRSYRVPVPPPSLNSKPGSYWAAGFLNKLSSIGTLWRIS